MRFLTAAVILTGIVLAWLSWGTYRSYQITKLAMQRNLRIEQLRGTIIHLDEVLTMSARMAAATGDLAWEERYRQYEPQLDAAIKEAIATAPHAYTGDTLRKPTLPIPSWWRWRTGPLSSCGRIGWKKHDLSFSAANTKLRSRSMLTE